MMTFFNLDVKPGPGRMVSVFVSQSLTSTDYSVGAF